ncbi:MAG: NAD(P)H-binding protein [Phenylobacterium sp.]|uniref:NAD(P)H-binding protein n=1 Tax=Phenylobacterium sp. TaxID=1871053 RepID=UPI0025F06930|nr:NAD(P)H-binding protein [Phenylobacterium sp.]MCA3750548.1 NAD(P)H-binding protein [Phenylobacterium sp.]MCA6230585.1 NAD(P)H-binding protein [Phenylobacterium sp.]MCA6245025.1 NAD(P)H-binding protein [Phenylobacterium sp.]
MSLELANDHPNAWALFGATGVTGQMVLEQAMQRGHRPLLVGRDPQRLMALAAPRGLEFRQANLADPESLAVALKGRRALLNVAGPFSETGVPLIRAALSAGLSYADLNGEAPALQRLLDMDGEARRAGLTLVGGAGFGIAASDGLAAMVSEALGGADWLRISVASDSAHDSPAVAESTLAVLAGGGREIIDGEVVRRNLGRRRWRVLGADGSRQAFASAPLADLVGARHATGVRQIVAGVPMPASQAAVLSVIAPVLPALLKIPAVRRQVLSSSGHSGVAGLRAPVSRVWVEGGRGDTRCTGRLEGGEGYAMAAEIGVRAMEAICGGKAPIGAHTPATAFGPDFIRSVNGVRINFDVKP